MLLEGENRKDLLLERVGVMVMGEHSRNSFSVPLLAEEGTLSVQIKSSW